MDKGMNLYERLMAIRDEIQIPKDKRVPAGMGGYFARTEEMVLDKLRPLLKKYRIYYVRTNIREIFTSNSKVKIISTLKFFNVDNPREYINVQGIGTGNDGYIKISEGTDKYKNKFETTQTNGDKDSGAASTYSVKDALVKMFMVTEGNDPDHDATPNHEDDYSIRSDMGFEKSKTSKSYAPQNKSTAKTVTKTISDRQKCLDLLNNVVENGVFMAMGRKNKIENLNKYIYDQRTKWTGKIERAVSDTDIQSIYSDLSRLNEKS